MKEYGIGCLAVLGIFLLSFAISFLCTAAIVWLLCWALPLIGIILAILRSIFSSRVTVNK